MGRKSKRKSFKDFYGEEDGVKEDSALGKLKIVEEPGISRENDSSEAYVPCKNSKTSESTSVSNKSKMSNSTAAVSKSNATGGTGDVVKCKTPEKTSPCGKSNTPEGIDFSSKSKTPEGIDTPFKSKTSEGTGASTKSKTPEGIDISSKSKTPEGTGASTKSKTPEETSASTESKTPEKTGASTKSKTPEGTSGSSKSKKFHSKGSSGKPNFVEAMKGAHISEFSTPYARYTYDDIKESALERMEGASVLGFVEDFKWFGGPPPRIYRRATSVAERLPEQFCADGPKVRRSEADTMSKPAHICNFCGKTSVESCKRCSRCVAVSYCCKLCQRQDFKNHKSFCQRCDRYDTARARLYPAVRFFQDMKDAQDYNVLLKKMPTEKQYHGGAWCNVLVEMLGEIPHYKRHICLVRDLSGLITKVVFHDESNRYVHPSTDRAHRPLSRELGLCLVPGNFLLLVGVHWRRFSDGTIGIRVNDLASVYVIDLADHAMAGTYATEMEQAVERYDNSPKPLSLSPLQESFMNAFLKSVNLTDFV